MIGIATHEGFLKRVTVVMPPDMHKRLKLESIERDISMNDQIITAVQQYLNDCGSKKDAQ